MSTQNNAPNTTYNLKRVDKVALIIIWVMIALIIEQAFLRNSGTQFSVTLQGLTVGILVTVIALLKMNRFAKSLLMGLIPAVAVLAVVFLNPFSLDRHYMLCTTAVIIALYFNSKLLFVYGGIINVLLIAIYIVRPDHLLGDNNSFPYFLSIFFMLNGQIIALYFLTKWGAGIIANVEKSRTDLQEVFDQLQSSSRVQEKKAGFIRNEVEKLLNSMDRLSQGELSLHIEVQDADEDTLDVHGVFSGIAAKLLESVSSIRRYIAEISSVLEQVSMGDLRVGVVSEFRGDFAELKASINRIVTSLGGMLSDINIAAEQVASGTKQVSDGSQSISQGATEQASAIEQLTVSIADIATQTRDNAQKAFRASELSALAKANAEKGTLQMESLHQAMLAINEASSDISKIIKVVDEIAFQTNILALNAAVEAARAGVHGKGFAVVAEEVRNLAQRSAKAASETTALIAGSVKRAEAGTQIASDTADELNDIADAAEKAAALVGEIADASNAQATAISQVDRGIEQMSHVVQTNAATAEQAAAASEELSSQAELLKAQVNRFTLAQQ